MYVVYKITNLINNKSYIGKTKNLKRRILAHRYATPKKVSLIHNSILKYKFDNFKVDVLFNTDDLNELSDKEYYYIDYYNTFVPNGYNLSRKTDNKIEFEDETKKLISKKVQRVIRKNKGYSGIYKTKNGKYVTAIQYRNICYDKIFDSEIEAAMNYDRVALYLFGIDARINFEELRDDYIKEDLKTFFDDFSKKRPKNSAFMFLKKYKNDRWGVNKIKKVKDKLMFSIFDTEEEAAKMIDCIIIYYGLSYPLNLPHLELSKEYVNSIITDAKNKAKKTSMYKGISYCDKRKLWIVFYKQKYLGCAKTEVEAYKILLNNLDVLNGI